MLQINKFSDLSDETQYATIQAWILCWESLVEERSDKTYRTGNWCYLDLICYVHRAYRRDKSLLKPRASALVEGLLLRLPYISLLPANGHGCIRYTSNFDSTYIRGVNEHLNLPWLDWYMIEYITRDSLHTVTGFVSKINYVIPATEVTWSYSHNVDRPTTTEDQVLFLAQLSKAELRAMFPRPSV